jgi:methylated-DNA-[protein]-cysteine S-methyltransferase
MIQPSTLAQTTFSPMTPDPAQPQSTVSQWQMPIQTPLGAMTLVACEQGLQGAWFEQQAHHPTISGLPWGASQPWLRLAKQQLSEYFAGLRQQFDLPFQPYAGSEFQRKVWQAMAQIPYGRFASYADIARHLGQPQAARAIGMAVGRNPLSIFLPCHRVVASDGALTGYAGGIERKIALLQIEGTLL